ncbi:MAG TPA: endonuclease/exonuclease/phosphatase family protein [Actinomycetota bacterium]|nr:endonuclease/exonuclease/phosphatase family protein [Actinomycetota bacterium]
MPRATDPLPQDVQTEIDVLVAALDAEVPSRRLDENLLICTWNIRAFGGLVDKWRSSDQDSPKRDLLSLHCIANIVRRFDVVAIQEAKGNLRALRHMLDILGPDWGLILTDVTEGARGNDERLAFVFDMRRAKPSGLAAELVVPREWLERGSKDALEEQFARTPYAVSFLSGKQTFILVTLHVVFGKDPKERVPELRAIAEYMARWAKDINSWGQNLIVLGDFNIDRHGDPLYEAFTSTGLRTPAELNLVPRTIFGNSTSNFYDQIAWFTGENGIPALSLSYRGNAGHFDFTRHVMPGMPKQSLSWRMSDHFPLWAEFHTR